MAARRASWRALDAALSTGLTVAAIAELAIGGYSWITALCAAAVTVALNWRRSYPLMVITVGSCAWTVPILLGLIPSEAALTPLVALLIGVYSVARHAGTRAAVIGGAVALAAALASDLRLPDPAAGDFGFTAILISWPWFAGYALRGHQLAQAALSQRAELMAAEHDARAREAVAEERARIARELHDVIAHSVSVMVVQAGAAEEVAAQQPDRAIAAMAAIRDTGREALIDLRRMLGLLRRGEMAPTLAPMPGIADLEALANQLHTAGLPVQVRVTGAEFPLPAGLDLTAFRLIQEALTNTLKHAGAGHADVDIRFQPDALSITVTDDGRGGTSPAASNGHGLTGMRERVTLYGGDLEAGPGPDGGYRVTARLPLGYSQ
jgi:signal transduction histidine kinase